MTHTPNSSQDRELTMGELRYLAEREDPIGESAREQLRLIAWIQSGAPYALLPPKQEGGG